MSYSRWSHSRWYTFWHVQDSATENRDTAIFSVCGEESFTAKELREDADACIDKCESCTEEEREELRQYMERFLADVNEELGRRETETMSSSCAKRTLSG